MKLDIEMPSVAGQSLRVSAILVCLYAFAGCTWVKPIGQAAEVALVQPTHVVQCQSLGTTRVSVKDRLGILKRSERKVSEELSTLAKNSAVSMGGDTIVEKTEVIDGAQDFAIYQCNK